MPGFVKCGSCKKLLAEVKDVGGGKSQLASYGFSIRKGVENGKVTITCECGADTKAEAALFAFLTGR